MARSESRVDVMQLALLGLGAYLVIKYVLPVFQSAAAGISAVGQAVGQGGANAYLALTNPSVLQPTGVTMPIPGAVTFPNGVQIPWVAVENQTGLWTASDSAGNFYFTAPGMPGVWVLGGNSSSGYTATASQYATLAQANAA